MVADCYFPSAHAEHLRLPGHSSDLAVPQRHCAKAALSLFVFARGEGGSIAGDWGDRGLCICRTVPSAAGGGCVPAAHCMSLSWFREADGGIYLNIKVQPRASRNKIQ